jgi:hypothetical protein
MAAAGVIRARRRRRRCSRVTGVLDLRQLAICAADAGSPRRAFARDRARFGDLGDADARLGRASRSGRVTTRRLAALGQHEAARDDRRRLPR